MSVSMENLSSPTFDWFGQLSEKGYRLTSANRAVVEVIANSPKVLSPAEVFIEARRSYPAIGLVTVYRTLEKLEELALVQKVHLHQNCHGYIAAASGHNHLLICSECGRAESFSGDDLSQLIATISKAYKYYIVDHWLQLIGVCQNCRSEAKVEARL